MVETTSAFFLVIALQFAGFSYSERLKEIRLQGFLPMTGPTWPAGSACLTPTLMALRHVNERVGLLDGYNVTYTWADSKCSAATAAFEMFQSLSKPPPKHMLLGEACSVATVPMAEISHLFNLTQVIDFTLQSALILTGFFEIRSWNSFCGHFISSVDLRWAVASYRKKNTNFDQISYASSSPVLTDRKRFPNFYQIDSPDHAFNPVKIALMKEFGWSRVATINEAVESYHSVVIDDFVQKVSQSNVDIRVITQELFHTDPIRRVENLKKHDARIIVVQMYEDKARAMLCAAYKLGMYGRRYVWIFNNWQSAEFWKPKNDVPCSEEEMSQTVEGAFLLGPYSKNPRSKKGIAGLTEFEELYRKEETYDPSKDVYYLCTPLAYDHIWVAALALNCTEWYLRSTGHPKHLDEFTYQDSDINDVILSCMNNLSLDGLSGHIFYGGNVAPMNKDVQIERIQDSKRITVGTYVMAEGIKRFEWIKGALKWQENKIPRDSSVVKYEEIKIPMWLYVVMTSCAGAGLLLAVGCFVFNVVYRNNTALKIERPTKDSIWLLGCMLIYSTVFMTTTLSQSAMICKVKTFCFTVGFTAVVGTFYFKTWRVYSNFLQTKTEGQSGSKKLWKWIPRKSQVHVKQKPQLTTKSNGTPKETSDFDVITRAFTLVACIVVVFIIWETISPQYILKALKEIYVTDDDIEVQPFIHICNSKYNMYFSWTIYIIEGTVLLFGAFLCLETKNVNDERHSDNKKVGICLYNTLVLSIFGLTVSILLKDNIVVVYGLTSACVVIGTTVSLLTMFIPKVVLICQRQSSVQPLEQMIGEGARSFTIATGSVTIATGSATSQIEETE